MMRILCLAAIGLLSSFNWWATGKSGSALPAMRVSTNWVGVEFLDDIPLRCEDDRTGITYEAVVKTGSTFSVKP
jgi:hypothetical protein